MRLVVMLVLLCLQLSAQALAQEEGVVLSEQDEAEQSSQDNSNVNEIAVEEAPQESNTEASPEVFNPTEEIIDDTAVSFPVDI